jgi:hypothetical protein
MAFDWNFRELMPKRLADAYARQNGDYSSLLTQNMDNRQAGNADDMMQWMQQGNDYQAHQQEQAALAQQQQEQAAAQKQSQIQSIQNQIAELEQRITANKAKLKDWGGVENQIAAIEARKINGQDPTSVWRWKVDREDARRIANAQNDGKNTAKANALIEANNILDSMIINDSLDTPTKNAMLSKLADVKSNLEKNGFDSSRVKEMIAKLKGNGEQTPREQSTTDFETLLNNPNLSVELLDKFEASNPNLSRADWGKLDNKRAELTKKDNKIKLNKRYEAARKKAGIDSYTWSLMSDAKKKEVLEQSGL